VSVVLEELLGGDLAVGLIAVNCVVMLLKSLEELSEDFVFSSSSRLDLGVHRGVVLALDVFEVEHTVAVDVDLLENADHNLSSEVVQGTDHHSDEFVEVNGTVALPVERLEKTGDVFIVDTDLEVFDGLGELVLVEVARVVVVKDLELASKANQTTASS